VSVAFTSTGVFSGPLALGVFKGSSLGFILGFFVTLALYGGMKALARPHRRGSVVGAGARVAGQDENR
jgi:biotin transporter BioY